MFGGAAVTSSARNRLAQTLRVERGAVGVRDREAADGVGERSAPAEVAGDESGADRARVRTRERASAQRGVVDETGGPHPEQVDAPLHVSQLPHVEVGAVRVRPAEEDVAHRLHRALTDDDALAAVLVLAAADVRLEHRHPRFLHLQEQRIERTPPFEQDDCATRADAADTDDLLRDVAEVVLLDEEAAVVGQRLAVLPVELVDLRFEHASPGRSGR